MQLKYLLIMLIFGGISSNLFSWGTGHDDQIKLVIDKLPEKIKTHFSKHDIKEAISHWSHYPDSFKPFEGEVGEKGRDILKRFGVKKRYDLHTAEGQAAAFMILTQMFKDKNYGQAALWLGALGHSLGDAGAPNHHPLIAWYIFMPAFELKNGKTSKDFSFGSLSRCLKTTIGQEALVKEMKGFKPQLLVKPGKDMAKRALVRLMELELEEGKEMTRDAGIIINAWQMKIEAKTPAELANADKLAAVGWAKLIAKPAKNIVDTIVTAYYLAENDTQITDLDMKKALKQHKSDFKLKARQRSAEHDSIFDGLLGQSAKAAKIAVIYEPTYMMNHGQLGFESKYYAAAVMHALKERGIDYKPIDVRDLVTNNVLNPKNTPVLILPAYKKPASYGGITSKQVLVALDDFVKKGGKILQIGQAPISIIARNVVLLKSKKRVPIDPKELLHTSFKFMSPTDQKDLAFKLSKTPFTKAGWHYPNVRGYVERLQKNQMPCIELIHNNKRFILGIYVKKENAIQHCFLPQLALFPYISGNDINEDVSKATFDEKGKAILFPVIKSMLQSTSNNG